MKRLLDASLVIARRDFVATVWSKTFLLFLLAPILALGFGGLVGFMTGDTDARATQPTVAVVAEAPTAAALEASRAQLAQAMGEMSLPALQMIPPEEDVGVQAKRLLGNEEAGITAVLSGTLDRPVLTAPESTGDRLTEKIALLVDEARRSRALDAAGVDVEPVTIERVMAEKSAGSLSMVRYGLARVGQVLIFFLTLMLGTMLLSNLVEEKSSKVIEILSAAVPLDAVFLGKLIAMLGVSLVGILLWGALAAVGLSHIQEAISVPVTPAVGWPAYCVLLILYFTANYMLLGAVFLGIGGQANNVREVQTLSMPVTFAQLAIFLLAGTVVGDDGGTLTWIAAIFPLSSPLAMIAVATESDELWPHLLALVWQAIWVAIIIRASAALFRRTVLKSGKPASFLGLFRTKKA